MAFHDGQLTLIPDSSPCFRQFRWASGSSGAADWRWTVLALLALVHIDLVIALTIFPIPIAARSSTGSPAA